MSKKSLQHPNLDRVVMTFSQLTVSLLSFIVGTMVVILLANLFLPTQIVLGTDMVSPFAATFFAATVVSLIAVGVMPVVEYFTSSGKLVMTNTHWLLLYWGINTGAMWLVGRFAEILGVGIRSWLVAFFLALVIDLVQGGLMKQVVSRLTQD